MTTSTTAADVKAALHRRYNRPSQGRPGEQYVCIEEARSGAGFSGNNGQCDFLAINTWQSRGLELIGHEVKVSMSDWKAELAQPEKAERFARYCRRWFVAAPSDLAKRIRDEVPPAWGLLSITPSGRCTEVAPAKARQPDDVPSWWWIGWLAQIDRQHKRQIPALVEAGIREERAGLRERVEQEVARRREFDDRAGAELAENVDRLKAATGIDLRHVWRGDLDSLARAWTLVKASPDLAGLVANLRRAADALESTASEVAA